jgi:hypothetical protein
VSLLPWQDDSLYPHGEPVTPGQALVFGVVLVIAVLLIVFGGSEFTVALDAHIRAGS